MVHAASQLTFENKLHLNEVTAASHRRGKKTQPNRKALTSGLARLSVASEGSL